MMEQVHPFESFLSLMQKLGKDERGITPLLKEKVLSLPRSLGGRGTKQKTARGALPCGRAPRAILFMSAPLFYPRRSRRPRRFSARAAPRTLHSPRIPMRYFSR